ncbi:MAG: long-chain fatty acid--CoA ligase [Sphingobacteriia bacterium]|nr:long-chain fatty acid--CoA ligase [Sphingobacteriia bacterium]NCC40523.1 long-chain fatty acid--CoA ligase [Gammaproteobacteria bacterium]
MHTDTHPVELNVALPSLLRETVRRLVTRTAIHFAGRDTSFAEFDALSDRVAAHLAAQGVQPGDRIGLYCPNSDAFAIAYYGILKAGAIVVPINLLLAPPEVAWILDDAQATGLIWHEAFAPAVAQIRSRLGTGLHELWIGAQRPADVAAAVPGWLEALQATGPVPQPAIDPREDVAVILYTSGTTGKPKGAMLTHRNLASNTNSVRLALELEPGNDTFLVVLPMFHAFAATVGMLYPLCHGGTIVPLSRFDPAEVARTIEAHQASIFFAVPSMYSLLLRLPDEDVARFKSLRFGISGGAALPVEILRQFETRFGLPILEGDGPTECSPVTCVNPVHGVRKPGTVGPAVPGVEMKILDDAGTELPLGEIGEICVRGPNVMKGYWKRPEATAECFTGEWFRTGDLGSQDEDGYVSILDRKKDMIIVNGMNVYPREIEEVLYTHGAIREVAVVGEPHESHGEIPVAYVVVDRDITGMELRDFLKPLLGRHKIPRRFQFVGALPKTATGKILKRELRLQGELERGVDARPGDSD